MCFSIMLHLFSILSIFIRKTHDNVNPNNISTHDVILSILKAHLRRHVSEYPSMNFRFRVDHRGNFSLKLQVLCQNCQVNGYSPQIIHNSSSNFILRWHREGNYTILLYTPANNANQIEKTARHGEYVRILSLIFNMSFLKI